MLDYLLYLNKVENDKNQNDKIFCILELYKKSF